MPEFLDTPLTGIILAALILGGCGWGIWRSHVIGRRAREKIAARRLPEEALLVYLPLSDDQFGTESERHAIHELTDALDHAIRAAKVGEFDGDEFGAGQCTLFMYGANADQLFSTVEPILIASPLSRGGYAIRRYGRPDDPDAREVRVEIGRP